VLGSCSGDFTTKVWDIEKGMNISTCQHEQLIQDFAWDYTGAVMASSSKDKKIRVIDPRTGAVGLEKSDAHEGSKSMKLTFLGNLDRLVSVGFTRQSQRQFKVWDFRNMEKELVKVDIDQAAGVIMPFYDQDAHLLFLAGKGDGNIRYYEMSADKPYQFAVSDYKSTVAAKGVAMVPKRGLDIMSCEVTRILKLTSNSIEPLKFIVPRKSDAFQEDIFPDTFSGVPSQSADEWLAGENKAPLLMNLRPGASGTSSTGPKAPVNIPKSAMALQRELDAANAKIAELEAKLAAAGLS
jgi:coronin-1B/1C/6